MLWWILCVKQHPVIQYAYRECPYSIAKRHKKELEKTCVNIKEVLSSFNKLIMDNIIISLMPWKLSNYYLSKKSMKINTRYIKIIIWELISFSSFLSCASLYIYIFSSDSFIMWFFITQIVVSFNLILSCRFSFYWHDEIKRFSFKQNYAFIFLILLLYFIIGIIYTLMILFWWYEALKKVHMRKLRARFKNLTVIKNLNYEEWSWLWFYEKFSN